MSDEKLTRQQRRASARSQLKLVTKPVEFDDAVNAVPQQPSTQYSLSELMHRMGQSIVRTTLLDEEEPEKVIKIAQGAKYGVAQITQHAMNQLTISVMPIECGKGCDYCCYMNVLASPVEVLNIAKQLKNTMSYDELYSLIEQIRLVSIRVAALPSAQARDDAHIPCGLLKDHQCSVYKSRPLACLGWTSASKQDCKDVYDGNMLTRRLQPASLTIGAHLQ